MPAALRVHPLLVTILLGAGCAGGPQAADPAPAPAAAIRPLAGLAAQRIVVAPVSAVREGDPMGWAASIPRQREWLRALDREITVAVGGRGLDRAWVFPETLLRSYERNPAMSPDPYRLATEPVRSITRLTGSERIPEPLASQLRTLVAVHDGRYVLVPLEVSFEPGTAGGRARLRLVLLDARSTEFRWMGEVRSDPSSSLNPAVATSLAERVADLIAAP